MGAVPSLNTHTRYSRTTPWLTLSLACVDCFHPMERALILSAMTRPLMGREARRFVPCEQNTTSLQLPRHRKKIKYTHRVVICTIPGLILPRLNTRRRTRYFRYSLQPRALIQQRPYPTPAHGVHVRKQRTRETVAYSNDPSIRIRRQLFTLDTHTLIRKTRFSGSVVSRRFWMFLDVRHSADDVPPVRRVGLRGDHAGARQQTGAQVIGLE